MLNTLSLSISRILSRSLIFLSKSFLLLITLWCTSNNLYGPTRVYTTFLYFQVRIRGTKDYFTSFNDSRHYITQETYFTVEGLYPGSKYTIDVTCETGGGEGDIESYEETIKIASMLAIVSIFMRSLLVVSFEIL